MWYKLNNNNYFLYNKSAVESNAADPAKRISVILTVEQPDIILVERMDDINCLALIMNVCAYKFVILLSFHF